MNPLYERYRPTSFDGVLGQDKAVAQLRGIESRGGFGGRAVWISGASGTGKTTLARIIAAQHCGAAGVTELDSADELKTDELDAIDAALAFRPLWGGLERRCWIINEAHALKGSSIRRLLGILERVARDTDGRVCVIFTTTVDGQEDLFGNQLDAGPLLSRCVQVRLTNQSLAKVFAEQARTIAKAEGLDGLPIESYVRLAQKHKNNLRGMLTDIDAGLMLQA